jgi:rare lipoprotein A
MTTALHSLQRNLLLAAGVILAGCSTAPVIEESDGLRHEPPKSMDLASIPDAVPQLEPISRYGNPERYRVFGQEYTTLKDFRGYQARGVASWYGSKFHGQRTSSGETYDMFAMTAAHKTLPIPCYARITNLRNGRSVVVKINDRGPFHDDRLIDLSYTAAWKLGIIDQGTGLVEVETIVPAPPQRVPQIKVVLTEPHQSKAHEPSPPLKVTQTRDAAAAYFLQVGAFGNVENAQRLKSRLESELETGVLVEQHQLAETPIYRVQVGPIADIDLCDRLASRLNGMGIPDARLVVR